MKIRNLVLPLLGAFILFSCNNQISRNQLKLVSTTKNYAISQNIGVVLLKIYPNSLKTNYGFKTKNVDFSNGLIKRLKLEVFGNGISVPASEVKNWQKDQNITFSLNVLKGKNRILRLSTLDQNEQEISVLMGVIDVNSEQNIADINYFDTVIAQILFKVFKSNNPALLEKINLSDLRTLLINITGFDQTKNTYIKSPFILNIDKIANLIIVANGSIPSQIIIDNLPDIKQSGKVKVNMNITGARVTITDLNSGIVTLTNNSTLFENVSYGKWKLIATKEGYSTFITDVEINTPEMKEFTINLNKISLPPTLTSVEPVSGQADSIIKIKGTDFSLNPKDNKVKFTFGKTILDAEIISSKADELSVKVPYLIDQTSDTSGNINVSVNNVSISKVINFTLNLSEHVKALQELQSIHLASREVSLDKLYVTVPDIPNCSEGVLRGTERNYLLKIINNIRKLHGLDPVTYVSSDERVTTQAALVMVANSILTHTTLPSHKCYSDDSLEGSSKSNVYIKYYYNDVSTYVNSEAAIDLFMKEVEDLGHRKWLTDPFLDHVSIARVDGKPFNPPEIKANTSITVKVVNDITRDISGLNLDFVAYPYKEYPGHLFSTEDYMSFSVLADKTNALNNKSVDFSEASVELSERNGSKIPIHTLKFDNVYQGIPNTLKWKSDLIKVNKVYDVKINNVKFLDSIKNYEYWFMIK